MFINLFLWGFTSLSTLYRSYHDASLEGQRKPVRTVGDKVLYYNLQTNSKQLPAFPLEAVPGTKPQYQRWDLRLLPPCSLKVAVKTIGGEKGGSIRKRALLQKLRYFILYFFPAMVVVDDGEVYDDGTSAPPPPPTTNADILRKKPPARAPSPSPSPPPPPVKFDAMYYGLWPCENVGEHELEFSRGACIEVVNKDRYDSKGWWVGKLGGKVGLVPKDYMFPMYKQI